MEGAIVMGYVEIIHQWDECDKCARRIPITEGNYTRADGLALIFTCEACK